MKDNDHIRQFLQYYCSLDRPPEYAVLLTGSWGCGKTWFIKDFLKGRSKSAKDSLYVSLYGVQTYADIDDEFYRLLHPLLASRGARLLGKLAAGALKATTSIDLNSNGKADGSVSLGIPTIDLAEMMDIPENAVLVFDDIERCSIPTHDLLGYINHFVEHKGFKTILVANEKELLRAGDSDSAHFSSYRRIKEKVVGRAFSVAPEFDSALNAFAADLPSEVGRAVIGSNLAVVAESYASSQYDNLRLLRHSLWDFDRLLNSLDTRVLENPQLLTELLSEFLAFSFEVRSGSVDPSDLQKIRSSVYTGLRQNRDAPNPDHRFEVIRKKYDRFDLYRPLIPDVVWQVHFATGGIPENAFNASLLKSKYFQDSTQPNWVSYWHGYALSDERFSEVSAAVEREWHEHEYHEVGEVLHVAGLLLKYSKAGVIEKPQEEILSQAKAYVSWLKENLLLEAATPDRLAIGERDVHAGLGFNEMNDPHFKELYRFVDEQRMEVLKASFPAQAQRLLDLMTTDPEAFRRRLVLSNHSENQYYDKPILVELNPEVFVSALIALPFEATSVIRLALKERYRFPQFNKELLPELAWLRSVVALVHSEVARRKGKISAYTLGVLENGLLTEAIAPLERASSHGLAPHSKEAAIAGGLDEPTSDVSDPKTSEPAP